MQTADTEMEGNQTLAAIKDEIAHLKSVTLVEIQKFEKNLKKIQTAKRHREPSLVEKYAISEQPIQIFTAVDPSAPPLCESIRQLDIK